MNDFIERELRTQTDLLAEILECLKETNAVPERAFGAWDGHAWMVRANGDIVTQPTLARMHAQIIGWRNFHLQAREIGADGMPVNE